MTSGGWILWVESHHDYNYDYDHHHHDSQGPHCHGEEPGARQPSPLARRRVRPAMRQVSCHRILGGFFKCILSLLITQYLCIWSLALLIAKCFSFLSKVVTCTCNAGPGRFAGRPLFSRAWHFSARWSVFPLEKNPKNYLPDSNENDFNSLKLKIFLFVECLNMVRNENVLLDPNFEALCSFT